MPRQKAKFVMVAMALCFCEAFSPVRIAGQQGAAVLANIGEEPATARRTQQPVSAVPEGFEGLTLAPGMLLQMEVYGIPEMSQQLRVDALGDVTIPLIGALHVAGATAAQAQMAIAKEFFERELFEDPQVTLNVLQIPASSVSVTGEVQTPGRIQLLAPAPLGDVLAMAGGETNAAGDDLELQHRAAGGETSRNIHYAPGSDPAILRTTVVEPGDSISVHRAGVIYVLGAVNRPGGYWMVDGGALNIVQAVSLAGGETLESSTRWVLIVRKRGDSYEQLKAPLAKMERGEAPAMPLHANDALYIPSSRWKSAMMSGSSVLSAAAAASIYAVANNP